MMLGKTYSMVGPSILRRDVNDPDIGIIPRTLRDLFQQERDAQRNGSVVNFRVSFVEIYNEEFKDLLHPEIPSREIMIREDKDGRIFFTGAREESVSSVEQAYAYLDKGNLSRTTAETLMNATSSRSHAIFTISIEVFVPSTELSAESEGPSDKHKMIVGGEYIQSKLHIVDLAGSERAKRTGAGGVRLKESVGINQGLLSLGKVIRALTSSANGATAHVPYRESKLTRFLQDSLGGNSRTVMLACISPAEINLHETLNTLQYASRARAVQNRVIANISIAPSIVVEAPDNDVESNIIGILRAQIQKMHQEIAGLKQDQPMAAPPRSPSKPGKGQEQELLTAYQRCWTTFKQAQEDLHNELSLIDSDGQQQGQAVSMKSCGVAWNLVLLCRRLVIQLESSLQHVSSYHHHSTASASSLSQSQEWKVSLDRDEMKRLEQELADCREDLKRDEEIFAEKVKELKQCRKLLRQVECERDDLKSIVEDLQRKPHLPVAGTVAGSGGAEDDMELSVAVAATEPDISQLMEDLETISREKELLSADKQRSEQSYRDAMMMVQQQQIDYQRLQADLEAKLELLQEEIQRKHKQMDEMKESHYQLSEQAVLHQHRANDLELERTRLRAQIQELAQTSQLSAKEVAEEKNLRLDYEHKLRRIEVGVLLSLYLPYIP
jgi:hypothetical protein